MQQIIAVAGTTSDHEIRRRLVKHMTRLEIPAEPEALKIERDGKTMRISLSYDEILYITFREKDYDLHTFHFDAFAEGEF